MEKPKFVNKYENFSERQGTIAQGESITDQSMAEDVDIYKCIEKYGVSSLVNKTQAEEFLYLDNTNRDMGLAEAVRQRQEMEEYFLNMPARARKIFGDDVDQFIEKYKNREFDDFLTTGALSEEQINNIKASDLEYENAKKEEIKKQYKEQLKAELEAERELQQVQPTEPTKGVDNV